MSLQRPSPFVALSHAASESVPPALQPAAESLQHSLLASVRGLAFWTAVLLPLTYLPLFFGEVGASLGLAGSEPHIIVGLLALNALAFLVGHGHNQPDEAA